MSLMVQKGDKGDMETSNSKIGHKDTTEDKKELATLHSGESQEGQEPTPSPLSLS